MHDLDGVWPRGEWVVIQRRGVDSSPIDIHLSPPAPYVHIQLAGSGRLFGNCGLLDLYFRCWYRFDHPNGFKWWLWWKR